MRKLLLILMAFAVVNSTAFADKPVVHKTNNSLKKAKELKVQEPKEAQVGIPAFMDTEKNRQLHQKLNRIPKKTSTGSLRSTHLVEAGKMTLKLTKMEVSSNPDAATIILLVDAEDETGIWEDGSGYQILLDPTHNIDWESDFLDEFGDFICDLQTTYDYFQYKVPADAEGLCSTQNMVIKGEASIEIPGGIYDILVVNPNYFPDFDAGLIFIASNGYFDDMELKDGVVYTFSVSIVGMSDYVTVTASDGSIAPDAPESLYLPTLGTLYLGMSKDWESFQDVTFAYAPAYTTWTFKNLTSQVSDEQKALWLYEDYYDDYKAETTDLVMDVTFNSYTMPELNTCIGTDCTSYIHGATTYSDEAYIDAGGGYYDDGEVSIGFTNANPDLGYAAWRWSDNDYVFGTGPSSATLEGLISYYTCDPDKYIYFEGVNVFFGTLTGPANTELRLTVVKASKAPTGALIIGDTIAVGKATIADANYVTGYSLGTLPFVDFFAVDEFGFEAPIDYFEIQGSFALILTGYQVAGVALSVVSEREDRPDADTERYAYLLGKDGKYYFYTNLHNTMLFQLENAYYSFITSEITKIAADIDGGDYTVKLFPYFNEVWIGNELPEWIEDVSFNDHFVQEGDWYTTANITVSPNTSAARSFDIEFATWGARQIVTISQDVYTGLSITTAANSKVVSKNNNFELTYTPDYSAVSVYNVAGQKVADYLLPANGKFNIPSGNYPQGVYLFSFTGAKGATTVKMLK